MTTATKLCPLCKEEIKWDAVRCKHCHATLELNVPPGGGAPAPGQLSQGTPAPRLLRGNLIGAGRFEVGELLGKGGMGEVYKAHHVFADRDVAIKVLWPHLMADNTTRHRFLEEGRVLARLRHQNIVEFVDVFQEEGVFFLVMEFINGRPLSDVLEKLAGAGRKLSIDDAVSCLDGTLGGLAYTHAQNPIVIHRDIKPSNIMLDSVNRRPVIMDFGIAKVVGRQKLTATHSALGTCEYMSPEHLMGNELTPAADVYSIGIVAYEMLTGNVPFPQTGDGLADVFDGHRFRQPRPIQEVRSDCPKWLAEVVNKALAKEASARFRDAGEMLAAMRKRASGGILVLPSEMVGKLDQNAVETTLRAGSGQSSTISRMPQNETRQGDSGRVQEPAVRPAAAVSKSADVAPLRGHSGAAASVGIVASEPGQTGVAPVSGQMPLGTGQIPGDYQAVSGSTGDVHKGHGDVGAGNGRSYTALWATLIYLGFAVVSFLALR